MIEVFDNTRRYGITPSGDLFWSIFCNSTSLLYIYPSFFRWFQEKVISGLADKSRMIIASYCKSRVAGYAVLKDTPEEQKICTLQVLPEYRKRGYGRELFLACLFMLDRPVLTVSEYQLDLYSSTLSDLNFTLIDVMAGYTDKAREFVFRHGGRDAV